MSNLLDKASIILTPTAYNNGEALCVKPSDGSGDFDFSRNSAATRVNAQGLVENVQILSSNLVQNGDFSEEGSEEVSNGSFSQEGSELITNGNFSNGSTDWILDSGWSVSDNKALCDGTNLAYITQTAVLTTGKSYKVQFDIVDYTSGSIKYRDNGFVSGQSFSGVGSYTDYVVAGGGQFRLMSENFIGSIDNVSVREVGQDWVLGTGWSIGEDKATFDETIGGAGNLNQGNILTVGKTYKLTFDTLETNGGNLAYAFGNNSVFINNIQANTTHVVYGVADDVFLKIRGASNFNGSITNISVKEVGQNWDLGTGFSIGNNKAILTNGTDSTYQIFQGISGLNTKRLKVTFDISNFSGSAEIRYPLRHNITANGSYSFEGIGDFDRLQFQAKSGATTSFEVTNISVIEITDETSLPRINYEGFSYQDALGSEEIVNGDFSDGSADWNFTNVGGSNGWRISNSKAICDTIGVANGRNLNSSTSLVSGKSYKVTLDILQSEDEISIIVGATVISNAFPIGTNLGASYIINSSQHSGGMFSLYAGSSDLQEIDNVSVKEYLGQEVMPDSGCGSWLFEPQSTNLITYSEDFSQWTTSNSTEIANNAISPSGGMNAYKLYPNSSGNYRNLTTGGQILGLNTFSIFAKAGELQHLVLIDYDGGGAGIDFNLSTGVATDVSTSGFDSFDMVDYGNGWYRCIATATDGFSYWILSDNGGVSVTANGTDGLYMWGAQTEQQSYATSYIPTEGSTVTRNQDLCTNGGSLASINSTEGVLYAEIAALANDGTLRMIVLNDGTQSNRVGLQYSSTNNLITAAYDIGGAGQASLNYTLTDAKSFNKIAFKYKQNDFSLYVNGIEVATDVSGNVLPANTLNNFEFEYGDNRFFFYGKTKALAVWKEALSNSELQSLTTI